MPAKARVYRGRASHSDWDTATVECTMRVFAHSLVAECETGVIEMPLDEIVIECEGGKLPQFLFTHPKAPGWLLSTFDAAILEALLLQRNFGVRKQVQGISRQLDDKKRLKTTVLFLAVFFALGFVAINIAGWLVSLVVHQLPVKYEVELGRKVAVEVAEEIEFVSTAPTNEIKAQLKRILGKDLDQRYQVHVAVYDSPAPNAFVLPGGYFYVSTGLMDMAETPEEIAGVLAHEAAHLKHRHGLRSMIAQHGHGVVYKWLFGGSRNLVSALSAGADLLVGLTYSREMEREADDEGFKMLLAANINPRGIITLFEKLEDWDGADASDGARIFQTHPPTRERIDRMRKKWEKLPRKTGFVALERMTWKHREQPASIFDRIRERKNSQ